MNVVGALLRTIRHDDALICSTGKANDLLVAGGYDEAFSAQGFYGFGLGGAHGCALHICAIRPKTMALAFFRAASLNSST